MFVPWGGQVPLLQHQNPGTVVRYVVSADETDYAGAGAGKSTAHVFTKTPVQITVTGSHGSGANLQVIEGPTVVRGRSVSAARIRRLMVDRGGAMDRTGSGPGWAPALFCVPFPNMGAKMKEKWVAAISAPAPLPGGVPATYKLDMLGNGFARVTFKLDTNVPFKVVGSGELYINLGNGYIDHGRAKFNISFYVKGHPEHVTGHDILVCSIAPQ